ncbi:hypothetical protein XH92_13955 [Bradyrhizobium sp. CCBAU 53421]|nr:hypothetical protein XH92_13955 [Bradyrhizobium sp. CCBAU 53421]
MMIVNRASALAYFPVILRSREAASRRMHGPAGGRASFEARKGAHLRMTVELFQLADASV